MPDTSKKILSGQMPVSTTTIHGWPALIFGLPFIAAGICIFLLSLGIIPVRPPLTHNIKIIVGFMGVIFGIAGISVFINGLLGVLRSKDTENQNSHQKWSIDYKWNSQGVYGDEFSGVIKSLITAMFMTLFLVPFNLAFFIESKVLMGKVIIGIFDLILIGIWCNFIYLVIKFLKFGVSFIEFEQFPYFLGDELHVRLKMAKHVDVIENVKVYLRFIEEAYEVRRTSKGSRTVVVCYQIYEDMLDIPNNNRLQAQMYLPINFKIPNDRIYETSLKSRPPKYWRLYVTSQVKGVDYNTNFLIPIYQK